MPSHSFPDTRDSLLRTLRDGGSGTRPAAWKEFFERYAPAVFRVARRQGLGPQDADDIVQQTMMGVSAHIEKFTYDRDRGRFRQWVKTIAANKIRDLFRTYGKEIPHQASVEQTAEGCIDVRSEDAWREEWRIQDMHYCLDVVRREISPRRFESFEMYVLKGVSVDETARILGMTPTHVYVTRTKVVKRIRALMAKLDQEGGGA